MQRSWLPKIRWPKFNLFKSREAEDYQRKPTRVHQSAYTGVIFEDGPKAMMAPIIAKIAVDVSNVGIRHVQTKDERFESFKYSNLDFCFTTSANIDQTGPQFWIDLVSSLLDEGSVAVVPIETEVDDTGRQTDIYSLRVAKIEDWFAEDIQVRVYNEITGHEESKIVPKSYAAVIENPFSSVMNFPNSTVKRLSSKLATLDYIDKRSSSKRLDLIFQLPFAIKGRRKEEQAARRRDQIVDQLENSDLGIAYVDATERVIQLNRPVENQLWQQVMDLTNLLHAQLGMPAEVFNGTASEAQVNEYYTRTVYTIAKAITVALKRTFIARPDIDTGETIMYFPDPFKMVAPSKIAEMAEQLVRNEIATGNDFRVLFGWTPSSDPKADKLYNPQVAESRRSVTADDTPQEA